MKATIWHNPRCSTSRNAVQMLREAGIEPEVVNYLQTGWTETSLRSLLAEAGLTARQALRGKEPLAKELALLAETATEDQIIAAMIAHPILVERPFVRLDKTTVLARPLDRLGSLLP